jgi:[protein-PII] uridylyltransferase
VRSIGEVAALAADDLATMTAVMDARPLIPDDSGLTVRLGAEVRRLLGRGGDSNRFVRRLIEEKHTRHARFGDALFLLEPNLKHGRGTLRDLATGAWAAKARWRVPDLAALVPLGQATARQVATLGEAQDLLLRVRALLHLESKRAQDQLTFELQERIGPRLYPNATREGSAKGAVAPSVEELMRRFYLAARGVERETDRLLERAIVAPARAPTITKIDGTFVTFTGQLSVSDARIFRDRPSEMVRLFTVALDRKLPIYGHTKEVVAERVATDGARLAGDPLAQRTFVELLVDTRDKGSPSLLEEMHDLGLLAAIMPEFAPCTGRVQHDLYHVYTVDQHQLYAVALLKKIARGEVSIPVATAAARAVTRPAALYLATLLHDVGKPLGKGHSEKGARLAVVIGRRLGLSDADVGRAEFLVRHHLLMSHLSQRRDLDDVEMIAKFARVVGDEDTLRDLYLLTYCDTSMTSPGNMTGWKETLLRQLYVRTRAHLRRGPDLAGTETANLVKRRRQRIAELLGAEVAPADLDRWLDGMPDRYLTGVPPRAVAEHVRLSRARQSAPATLSVRPVPDRGCSELVVVAEDRPGLLARLTGVLLANRVDVVAAHINSRPGEAIDVFLVRDRAGRPIPDDDARWERVRRDLGQVFQGEVTVEDLIETRRDKGGLARRVTPAVATEVEMDNDVSEGFTVVDVYTQDRPGVLYAITSTLDRLGLDIALSKVATEADRVADVFYVRDRETGEKVLDPARQTDIRGALDAALGSV